MKARDDSRDLDGEGDNIKMNFKQIGWESVDRIVQADDRGQCPFL